MNPTLLSSSRSKHTNEMSAQCDTGPLEQSACPCACYTLGQTYTLCSLLQRPQSRRYFAFIPRVVVLAILGFSASYFHALLYFSCIILVDD